MIPPRDIATLTRRAALTTAAGAFVAGGAPAKVPGLNDRAIAGNRFFGTAINDRLLADDPAYMRRVQADCGMVTGETAFKWGELRPEPDQWDWRGADAIMAFAARRGIQVRGHTMLWHEHNPAWLVQDITPANAEHLLTQHIDAVAKHCRGRLVQWDVVNEVLDPQAGRPLGLRDTLWSQAMGPRFLDVAFHACAAADPVPLRCINDFGLDYTWQLHERKRADMLSLLSGMQARGVPVQALGMQAHLEAGVAEFDQTRLAQFCNDVASMGLKIVITELDVRDNRIDGDIALRDSAVASHARAYLDAVFSCPATMGVLTWGLSDRRTWLNDVLPRDDKLAQRALPLDEDLRRKPLWTAIAEAFAAAPPRG